MSTRRIRNLGILAHVDAGKTTLTERMLSASGRIAEVGNVDKGTSQSDDLDVERHRGISVRASTLSLPWRDVHINVIDTPGHVDFAAEVERSLRVLDAAVLVLSAVEGLQPHAELIWQALVAMDLPVILYINKIDRIGADTAAVCERLAAELSPDLVRLNQPVDEGTSDASVAEPTAAQVTQLLEAVAVHDDALLESYLEGDVGPDDDRVKTALATCVARRQLFPVLCGSAKNGIGIEPLLDAIVDCLPDAAADAERPLSGVVFRLDHDARLGRVAGVRLFGGSLRNRDRIDNHTAGRQERITQVKRLSLQRYEDVDCLEAGDIGFVCGMPEVRIGDVLGDPAAVPEGYRLTQPLLSAQVRPADEARHTALAEALQQLASEDPHLDFRWFAEERELHVRIMGAIQVEILTEILRGRFGIEARFDAPTVIYRETPAQAGHGAESYTMPKPCWAIVGFDLKPGPRGSGVSYTCAVGRSDIHQKYQNEIAETIPGALRQGVRGWEVTDLAITLVEGSHHLLHSRPGDFKLATNMAVLKGLVETGTQLLEPILSFRVTAPEEFVGKVTGDVINMRGHLEPAHIANGQFELCGRVPLATSMDYAIRLSSLTGGRGALATHFDGYEPCPEEHGVDRPYRGISPLDRAKYILWWRGAITDSVKAPAPR